ncbi:hypothetical protein H5P28_19255 [Ruficoccus amylovorans]|uniref:Uncharacterized protein n=1 Tax=Ruficoccus amylovorans TaxID=1804625 RepID=A0A842HJ12_9BACT|nr:hypothetical protein [Ruficoccus amylovorans]MBC2596412.1 hypothetical protein [Ruficoccus amylovorans]
MAAKTKNRDSRQLKLTLSNEKSMGTAPQIEGTKSNIIYFKNCVNSVNEERRTRAMRSISRLYDELREM